MSKSKEQITASKAASNKKWRENNKEKIDAYKKKWKENNKEQIAAYEKEYREKNKEQIAAWNKEYYEKNIHYTDEFKGNTETVEGLIESKPLEDDIRRFESYKELIKGSEILDFGCGRGGFIQLSQKISKRTVGLELNRKNSE